MEQQHAAEPSVADGPSTGAGQAMTRADPCGPHWPVRPGWGCRSCGQEWPCRSGKSDLLDQYADDRVGLLVYLAGLLVDAVQDVETPPHLLLERFLRWAKIGESI